MKSLIEHHSGKPAGDRPESQRCLEFAAALLFVCLLLWNIAGQAREPELEPLVITTARGETVEYQVEVARTADQMRRGLMFRDSMPEDRGMLFVYLPERPASMWMKNTILSLDMLFIDAGGRIINIVENTEPYSLKTIPSGGPIRGVLELNAGQAEKHGMAVGDTVSHPIFE